jgi:5-oxoprolinase (ATP-hydrolysing)
MRLMASGWEITADTGGTFTDCLGIAPGGEEHRVKVLSSACLRGILCKVEGPRRFRVAVEWEAPANFLVGALMRIDGREIGRVAADEVGAGWVELVDPASRFDTFPEGAVVEWETGEEAPVLGARLLTGTPAGKPFPPLNLRLGTTRGTNALLEDKGAPTALFVTEGFRDLCRIGDQKRPDLFAREIRRADPLHHAVFEVPGRVSIEGEELVPLNLEAVDRQIAEAKAAGCTVAAVALIHSYRHPAHEQAVVARLRESGAFRYVVGSAELRPFIHYLRRAETALVDATLGPILEAYLDAVENGLGGGGLRVMTSGGSLRSRARFRPVDSLLSGPAGGVAGAALAGRRVGLERLIAFDMGGTSTDVSRWEGDFVYQDEQRVGRARILSRSVKIETVAAGGGSICSFAGDRLKVGPESAGANPGPACYGAGGPLTVTDVNLLLGRLDPNAFHIPVSQTAAEIAWEQLRADLPTSERGVAPEKILEGLLDLANERMAQAIREISVRDGSDPADAGLVAFGGAGGMHACAVAERLGMRTIVSPRNAGLLSAEGLQHASLEAIVERQPFLALAAWTETSATTWDELRQEAQAEMSAEGVQKLDRLLEERTLDLRLRGQDATLTVPAGDCAEVTEAFAMQFERLFGYRPKDPKIEVATARLRLRMPSADPALERFDVPSADSVTPKPARTLRAFFAGEWREIPVHRRDDLAAGAAVEGPALIIDPFSTFVLAPGWRLEKGEAGSLRARDQRPRGEAESLAAASELVEREIFLQRFYGIVREMGEQLRRTALSTNIRERLDFSCALLDGEGTLLVNAPHIPVHLGALGECARRVLETLPLGPGDVIVTNHPAFGGSHLPDVTVLSGVFVGERRIAILANRAHHAEIGGTRPGSMPPDARRLVEEGVVIAPTYLVRAGQSCFDEIEELLTSAPHPTRALGENLADLHAQLAANRRGEAMFAALLEKVGVELVLRHLHVGADLAEAAARRCFAALSAEPRSFRDSLDDAHLIQVAIEKCGEEGLKIDFTGSAGMHPGNLNATPAIVRSAVLYVLRLLIGEEMPLNEGLLRSVELHLPEGLLNPLFDPDPAVCPAVVGGNVETSQRVVEVLLGAFGLMAQSQGTMNNVLFGDPKFGYYETVGGGSGAGPGFAGASGVHVHMTNTAITDPEVLELRYPLRLWQFALRSDSGGAGAFRGGDGLVREYEFLRPMSVSLMTERRKFAPEGADGGRDGAVGRQWRIFPDGREEALAGRAAWDPAARERLRLETPGGGAWGVLPETKTEER